MTSTNWVRVCRYAVIFNILSLVIFTILIGSIAARKVSEQIEEGLANDAWIDMSFLLPSLLTAMITFLILRVLNDLFAKVLAAVNIGLGLFTLSM